MNFETSHLIYLLIILVMFVPAWWARGGSAGEKGRNALIWFVIIVALMLGWATFNPETFPVPGFVRGSVTHDI